MTTSNSIDARPQWGMRVRGHVRLNWRTVWWLAHALCTILYGYRAFGRERLPARGGYLLVANHQSFLDPIAVALGVTRRETFFLGRATLFSGPRWWSRFLLALNCIPLDTSRGDVGALRGAVQLARDGAPIVVFPEGSRSFDGALQPLQPGVTLLIKRGRVPVVPVGIDGAFDAYRRTQRFPKLLGSRIAVVYGDPIDADDLLREGPRAALDRISEEIEALRLTARRHLLQRTHGVFPTARLGDSRSAVLDLIEPAGHAAA